MTQKHPITPPQWQVDAWCKQALAMGADVDAVFLEAARWGADQELEACCEWVDSFQDKFVHSSDLCLVRRPKPPSLKEQARQALGRFLTNDHTQASQMTRDFEIIRRAVESLPD